MATDQDRILGICLTARVEDFLCGLQKLLSSFYLGEIVAGAHFLRHLDGSQR